MTQASALFEIDPGTGTFGPPGVAEDAGPVVTVICRLASVSGVAAVEWRIPGTHGAPTPAITLSGNPNGQIASFPVPSGLGQAYGIECRVNRNNPTLGDRIETSAVYILDPAGNRPFWLTETFEENTENYGIIPRLNSKAPTAVVAISTNRTVWVDPVVGTAGGAAGDLNKPFQTITQGLAAAGALTPTASNPVLVFVRTGTCTEAPLTVPSWVTLQGSGRTSTIIEASTATAALVTCSVDAHVSGLTIRGASGVGGIGLSHSSAGNQGIIRDCNIRDCETGILITGTGVSLGAFDVEVNNAPSESMIDGIKAFAGGTFSGANCFVRGAVGGILSGCGVVADGTGSLVIGVSYSASFATDGLCVRNDGMLVLAGGGAESCVNAVHIEATGGLIAIQGSQLTNSTAWNVLVEGGASSEFIIDSVLLDGKVSISPTATRFGSYLDRLDGGSVNILNELHVGTPASPAEAAIGGGDSHTLGVAYKHFDGVSVYTDITADLASPSGSAVAMFAGLTAGNALLIGGDPALGDFEGIKLHPTLETVLGAGEVKLEYWDGGAFVETNWMTSLADAPFTTSGKSLVPSATDPIHKRFGPLVGWTASTIDGDSRKWAQYRIHAAITRSAILEHVRVHTDHWEANSNGFTEWFGSARSYLGVQILTNWFESAGSPPAAQDMFPGAFCQVGMTRNLFAAGTDQVGIGIVMPVQTDTSWPLELKIWWLPMTAGAGNVKWDVVACPFTPGDVVATSAPGALPETVNTTVAAAPGVFGQVVTTTINVDISDIVTSADTILALMIRRENGDVLDTYTGNVAIVPGGIAARVLAWSPGQPRDS